MDLRTMLTRGVYLTFVAVLLSSTVVSLILQILSLEEGAYERAQLLNPNLPVEQHDSVQIDHQYRHIFPFMQVSNRPNDPTMHSSDVHQKLMIVHRYPTFT
jgi:hypothetical protein